MRPAKEPEPEAPEPEKADKGASDKKGWTVFGEPSPLAKDAALAAAAPAAEATPTPTPAAEPAPEKAQTGKTVMFSGPIKGPDGEVLKPPGAEASTPEKSDSGPPKTVIASSMQQGPSGGVTGKGATPETPSTTYSLRGTSGPEVAGGAVSPRSPTVRDVLPPGNAPAEAAERAADAPKPTTLPPAGKKGGGSMVLYIVIGVVAFGALGAAAFFAFS